MGNRLSKIYTRTGDSGTTGLGDGSRVAKDDLRITALGDVDELNATIGVLRSQISISPIEDKATITLSLNARNSNLSIDEVIESLREINHVTKVDLISMTM